MNPWTNPEQAERLKAYAEYTRFDSKPRDYRAYVARNAQGRAEAQRRAELDRRAHPDLFSSVRDIPLDNQNK